MKSLLLAALTGLLLFFAPRYAQAQTGYGCGEAEFIHVQCNSPCNGSMNVFWYTGYREGDNQWWAIFTVQCGSGQGCKQQIEDAMQAGFCYPNGVSGTLTTRDAPVNVEDTIYGYAYVRDCKGQYVPMRISI